MAEAAPTAELAGDPQTSGNVAAFRARSLRSRVLRGSLWMYAGAGASNVLRFGSNLVLARLLAPDAFGLMALVLAIRTGLEMLSDVGFNTSIVQNERGDDPAFLNTAFTMQLVRGAALWLVAVALAWPAAALYGEPMLLGLVPLVGLSALLLGATSTSLATLSRHLQIRVLACIDIGTQLVAVAVTIVLALATRSVWALAIGALVQPALRMIASHAIVPIERNRVAWDPAAARAMLHFGKWILLSTAVFFFVSRGDQMMLGAYVSMDVLGAYWVAVMISDTIVQQVTKMTQGVLFPAFSEVARADVGRVRRVYYRARLPLDAFSMLALGGLAVTGTWVIDLLYPPAYALGGPMLQALCVRAAMSCLLTPCETCLFSLGLTRYSFFRNVGRAAWILAGIPLGWRIAGVEGVLYAVALSEIPVLVILWWAASRHGLLSILHELRAVALAALGALAGGAFLALVPGVS